MRNVLRSARDVWAIITGRLPDMDPGPDPRLMWLREQRKASQEAVNVTLQEARQIEQTGNFLADYYRGMGGRRDA